MRPDSHCASFGDFILNVHSRELLNRGVRVKLQAQPLEVLVLLVDRRGELVTREELRQRLWDSNTYVDFDQGLNKAIKKIREALNDSADDPKYIQTLSRRGYRFVGNITWDGQPSSTPDASPLANNLRPLSSATAGKHKLWLGLIAVAVILAAGIIATWLVLRNRSAIRPIGDAHPALTRLTFDSGLQFGATFSPDGRFIAFSSDRGGKFDIWLQQMGSAAPHQITTLPGHNWQPDWSPDGSQIVFRSEGDQDGLFVVPAFGGQERRISTFGYRPRWSPDGKQILFEDTFAPGLGKTYVTTADGQAPREILAAFFGKEHITTRSVEWYPVGERVSVLGGSDEDGGFWTLDLDGRHVVSRKLIPPYGSN